MFCRECRRRPACREICPELTAYLAEVEGYQREIPFAPEKMALIADQALFTLQDLIQEPRRFRLQLFPLLDGLPPSLLLTFHLHYHRGLSSGQISRKLGIHRSTVNRRLKRARRILRRRLDRAGERGETEEGVPAREG